MNGHVYLSRRDVLKSVGILTVGTTLLAANCEADYICNGIDDHLEIQDALDNLPALGGTVELGEGIFNLGAPLMLPDKSVRLIGQGMPAGIQPSAQVSMLNFTLAEAGNCIEFSSANKGQAVENLGINGDGSNTNIGIRVNGAFKVVRDVSVYNVVSGGLRCENGSSQGIFENVYIRDLDCNGFVSFGIAMLFQGCNANRGSAIGVSDIYKGFDIHDSGSTYVGCITERYNQGFSIGSYANGNSIVGLHAERNNYSIFVGGAEGTESRGNSIRGGSIINDQGTQNGSVIISRAWGTTISGLFIGNNFFGLGFYVSSNAIDTLILGGWTETPTKISDNGIGTQVL